MARIAGGFDHRGMDAGFHQFGLQRRMRIMAVGAIDGAHRIVVVGFLKRRLVGIMAGPAESGGRNSQQVGLIRTVRKVTPQAGFFFKRRVNYGLVELIAFMAAKTQIVSGRIEQMGLIRGMRVMAVNAFPAFQGCVGFLFIQPNLFGFVARHT